MNINSVVLRQLARLGVESVDSLKTLDVLDKDDKPFRVSFNLNGNIELTIGQNVRRLDCNTDFHCACRTITIDSEHFYEIKCITVYVNNGSNRDDVITVTTAEYAKNLYTEEIEKIVKNLRSIESEGATIGRFNVKYKNNLIILEDRVKSITYRLDHIIQSILDLK